MHTMAGSLAGSDSWFQQTADQNKRVSSHYGIGLSGAKHQYTKLADQAWVNGILEAGNRWGKVLDAAGITASWQRALSPNAGTVGVETEDLNNPAQRVTDAEYVGTREVCLEALFYYPTIKVLSSHHVISPASRANCSGARWTTSGRLAQLAADLKLALVI